MLIWNVFYFMFIFSVDAVHLINVGRCSTSLSFVSGIELGHHFDWKLKLAFLLKSIWINCPEGSFSYENLLVLLGYYEKKFVSLRRTFFIINYIELIETTFKFLRNFKLSKESHLQEFYRLPFVYGMLQSVNINIVCPTDPWSY